MLSMQVHVCALCERLIPGVGCVKHASACVCALCEWLIPGVGCVKHASACACVV